MNPVPVVASSTTLLPVQKVVAPVGVIEAVGAGLIVTTSVVKQLAEVAYEMSEVPASTPVTFPDPSTVATDVFELLHVPPVAISLNVVMAPWQSDSVPFRAGGAAVTETTWVA